MKNKILILIATLLLFTSLFGEYFPADMSGAVGAWKPSEYNLIGTDKFTDLSGNGNVATSANAPTFVADQGGVSEQAQDFNGTDDEDTVGNIGDIKTIAGWIYPQTDDRSICDLDGVTTSVEISSGDLSSTGWTSPTYYVNGVATQTLTLNAWNHITITSGTAVTASALVIGNGASFFDGYISTFIPYSDEKSATWVSKQYSNGLVTANMVIDAENLFSGYDFRTWSPLGGYSDVQANNFTTATIGGVRKSGFLVVDNIYKMIIVGETNASAFRVSSGGGEVTYKVLNGTFDESFTFTCQSNINMYLFNIGAGLTTVTQLEIMDITAKHLDPLAGAEFYMPMHEDWNYTDYLIDLSAYGNDGYIDGATVCATYTDFDGNNDLVNSGNVTTTAKSIGFWVNLDSTTESIFEETDDVGVTVTNGTISYGSWDNCFVDNVDTDTITTGWHYILLTSTTDVDCSALRFGLVDTTYLDGSVAEVRIWNTDYNTLTALRAYVYNEFKGVYQ